jgi:hypothetical protein
MVYFAKPADMYTVKRGVYVVQNGVDLLQFQKPALICKYISNICNVITIKELFQYLLHF